MSKRTYEEKMDYYMRKMEKLKEKQSRKRRRSEVFYLSPEQNNQGGEASMWDYEEPLPDPEQISPVPDPDNPVLEVPLEPDPIQHDQTSAPSAPPEPVQISDDSSTLDPEILSALGEATDPGPAWGPDIHNNLTQLWQPLLKKGMAKDTKDKIFKQYLIPSNCTLLQAPKLNIEISAAVAEMVRTRDKKVETAQQQLGIGITAISRAMTSLLTSENKIEAIKILSDGCRILCDLHYTETQARIKMISPGLAKPFLNVIQDSERDETLFGTSLPEKIKASKTIEKQGLQIKKITPLPKFNPATGQSTFQTRQQTQGNYQGPPRYPSARGGRGGQRRVPSASRRPVQANATSAQPRASQGRPRVTTRP